MHVTSFKVHNVLRVSDAELDMEGQNLVLVGGANGHGKTSALTALLMALCGKRDMEWPDIALKEGETEGWVQVELTGEGEELHDDAGFTVELHLRKKRGGVVAEEFRVLDSTGEEAPEPRTLLKRLYNFRAFDPLDFERAKPKDKATLLRDLVGLDFTALDAERKKVYEERTVVNRQGTEKKAFVDGIKVPSGTPDEKLLVADLMKELQDAQSANRSNEELRLSVLDSEHNQRIALDEISKVEKKIEELKEKRKVLQAGYEANEKSLRLNREAVEKSVHVDLGPIQKKIEAADEINLAVEKKQQKKKANAELSVLRGHSQKLTDNLKKIDEEKQERLESAEWPLPGMSIDESGVLFNGLPFEQASKAQRVMASVRVGMALNPTLRLLVCEDGNDLDNETMAALQQALEENDFQMLLEVVTRDAMDEARCAVVFQDGAPKEYEEPVMETANEA